LALLCASEALASGNRKLNEAVFAEERSWKNGSSITRRLRRSEAAEKMIRERRTEARTRRDTQHTHVFGGSSVGWARSGLRMMMVACLVTESWSVGEDLEKDLDRQWAIRKGKEAELMAAALMIGQLAAIFTEQDGLRSAVGQAEARYAQAGRLIRLMDAMQGAVLEEVQQKHK